MKACLPWITICPPPGSSERCRWRILDEPRGAVPPFVSATCNVSVMVVSSANHPLSADTCSKRIAAAPRRQRRSCPQCLLRIVRPRCTMPPIPRALSAPRGSMGNATQERIMGTTQRWCVSVAAIAIAAVLVGSRVQLNAQQATNAAGISIGNTDLGGVVTGPNGPEAGVWVIAETSDLPTKFARIVVTDERGRYVVPDLPRANYSLWVRGYGLVDSPKLAAAPGKILNLNAVPAPTAAAAAEYYPAIY